MSDTELILKAISNNTELLNTALAKIEQISVRLVNIESQIWSIPKYKKGTTRTLPHGSIYKISSKV